MEPISPAIDTGKLINELSSANFLRETRKGNMEVYTFTYNEAPNLMLEVARLREVSFRLAGGGTGKSIDLDIHDVSPTPYKQLVVWNPREKDIVGGYRYAVCRHHFKSPDSRPDLSMADYFKFNHNFKLDYLPKSIELGRAWIQPKYQATAKNIRYIYALDNLWDGLGGLILQYPEIKYFYGKITLFPNYKSEARNILYWFLDHYLMDKENLMEPIHKTISANHFDYNALGFKGTDYTSDLKTLSLVLRQLGEFIPPLVSAYLNLTDQIKVFGTVFCPDFGNTYETGIMLRIKDIKEEMLKRYTTINQKVDVGYA